MANIQAQSRPGFPLVGRELLSSLADNWWLLLLRGVAAIAFGILAFFWPGLTLLTLTFLWGAYALWDAVFALGAAIFAKGVDLAPRWWLALLGIISILAGLVAFFYPGIQAYLVSASLRSSLGVALCFSESILELRNGFSRPIEFDGSAATNICCLYSFL